MALELFDSLLHFSPQGNTFAAGAEALKRSNFIGGCAVGLASQSGYAHSPFIKECRKYPRLVPIAGFDPLVPDVGGELLEIKRLGFKGIKIHPRLANVSLDAHRERLSAIFKGAHDHGLVVFLCTYLHDRLSRYPETDPLYSLVSLLKTAPETKVVLLHGGDVRLLAYSELARFNENLLLDLSYTMMKYQGSSLDQDIKFLMRTFDKRICIGTDYPEYSHADVRARFEALAEGMVVDKLERVASRNIMSFLGISNG